MEDKVKKDRSPQFPFIPLERAIERLRDFEAQYSRHQARMANAAKAWGYSEKSSGGLQTVAALCAFGLMEDEGSGSERKLKVSDFGMRILKEARTELREEMIKNAATKPKVLSELWDKWNAKRPPDDECVSTLHLDMGFTEDAARRLLAVYDATISFAKLTETDKLIDDAIAEAAAKLPPIPQHEDKARQAPPPPPKPKVQLMDSERVVFSQELRPNQSFRVIVNGPVDASVLKALKAYAEFQETMLEVLGDGKDKSGDSFN